MERAGLDVRALLERMSIKMNVLRGRCIEIQRSFGADQINGGGLSAEGAVLCSETDIGSTGNGRVRAVVENAASGVQRYRSAGRLNLAAQKDAAIARNRNAVVPLKETDIHSLVGLHGIRVDLGARGMLFSIGVVRPGPMRPIVVRRPRVDLPLAFLLIAFGDPAFKEVRLAIVVLACTNRDAGSKSGIFLFGRMA